ncbi:MAG: HEPN domain-containing protein [Armatimonadetes bacterium]|nr:HEPN domain-containing protein [Armatimonadota bacterium]
MSGSDAREEAARWLRYAAEDLAAAEVAVREAAFAPRRACWLAQQAAEKAIKAALVFLQVDFPWVHDPDALRRLPPEDWRTRRDDADLAELSEWAVEARYSPSSAPDPSTDDARKAVDGSRLVYASVA